MAWVGVNADVCRATTLEERTPILVGLGIARQLGLLFGPACNLFLRNVQFSIGWLTVNKLNAPGLFLVILYLILELLAAAFYFDLARSLQEERVAQRVDERSENEGEGAAIEGELATSNNSNRGAHDEPLLNPDVSWSEYKNEIIRPEIIALMFLRFIGFFGQACLEVNSSLFELANHSFYFSSDHGYPIDVQLLWFR